MVGLRIRDDRFQRTPKKILVETLGTDERRQRHRDLHFDAREITSNLVVLSHEKVEGGASLRTNQMRTGAAVRQ